MYTEGFIAWWSIYPRKVGKKAAFEKWKIAVREVEEEWLLKRTKLFAGSRAGRAGQYCPHPKTWLCQGRYDDDIAEWGVEEAPPIETECQQPSDNEMAVFMQQQAEKNTRRERGELKPFGSW